MTNFVLDPVIWQAIITAGVSLIFSAAIVYAAPSVPRFYGASRPQVGVQALHEFPTPRVGGIAIVGAFLISLLYAPVSLEETNGRFLTAVSILFVAGLLEDLGFGVSARMRLLAAFAASLTAILLFQVWLPRIDVPLLDPFLSNWIIGVPLTMLLTAGIANGFNLIDGVNGLAMLVVIAAGLALSLIAFDAGFLKQGHLSLLVAASTFGVFLFNFPLGRIFLGDAGAYTLGFTLSWFGIAILYNVPEVSAWAVLLTVFWPVADTLLTIHRRARARLAKMQPDRSHFHHLVLRALELHVLGIDKRHIANPLTTVVMAPFVIAPPIVGVLLWDRSTLAAFAVLGFGVLFFLSYTFVVARIARQN